MRKKKKHKKKGETYIKSICNTQGRLFPCFWEDGEMFSHMPTGKAMRWREEADNELLLDCLYRNV